MNRKTYQIRYQCISVESFCSVTIRSSVKTRGKPRPNMVTNSWKGSQDPVIRYGVQIYAQVQILLFLIFFSSFFFFFAQIDSLTLDEV